MIAIESNNIIMIRFEERGREIKPIEILFMQFNPLLNSE